MSIDELESLEGVELQSSSIGVAEGDIIVGEQHVRQVGQGELGRDGVALLAGEDGGLGGGDVPVSVLVTDKLSNWEHIKRTRVTRVYCSSQTYKFRLKIFLAVSGGLL